jgi:GR25 family glycosyltransferase involved in LPS biosynthesis
MRGLYINLDRSKRRRARLEAELERFGLAGNYSRIRAIEETEPYRGCWKSHIKAMEQVASLGGIVHIMADDVILSAQTATYLESEKLASLLETYDIVFLSMWVDPHPASIAAYTNALRRADGGLTHVDMREVRLGAMDSYVVAPRSVKRVMNLMRARLARPPLMANDSFLHDLVRAHTIAAAAVVPFVTCLDEETATQSALQTMPRDDQTRFVRLRSSFFVEPDRQQTFPVSLGGATAP